MMKFYDICKMSKRVLKAKLEKELRKTYTNVINADGFLYAEGDIDIPVMLEAHLDTVHPHTVKTIVEKATDSGVCVSSPEGIGGDDRCGIFMVLSLIERGYRPHVLFTEDEEIGCVGARKFTKGNIKPDIKYIIEFDRRGKNDCVFYDCANDEFVTYVEKFGFKFNTGSCSDISYTAPYLGVAAVNLSCGYYHEHHADEYVMIDEMMDNINKAENMLLDIDNCGKFVYIDKWASYNTYSNDIWGTFKKTVNIIDFSEGNFVIDDNGDMFDDHLYDGMFAIGSDNNVYIMSYDDDVAFKTEYRAYDVYGNALRFKNKALDTLEVYILSKNEYTTLYV